MTNGRPSTYSAEIADAICQRLSIGRSLNSISKDDDMPCMSTIMYWLNKSEAGQEGYEGFLDKYLRAREAQADVLFDECLEIADDKRGDYRFDPDKGLVVDGDHIQRAKLRVDTRMRMAGKLKPKKYGDKQTIGTEDNKPIELRMSWMPPKPE